MKWVPDRSGRFAQRPHYQPAEIDLECEEMVASFLRQRHGKVSFPIETDDLIVLLEREAADVDIYADLSAEGHEVEGITYFQSSGKPDVKIARNLSESPYSLHRFRTTATHELGHVKFHNFLWMREGQPGFLFDDPTPRLEDPSPRCRRETIQPLSRKDWMEWQAGYACGAFLLPLSHLDRVVAGTRAKKGWLAKPSMGSAEASELIAEVGRRFDVSADAARVRLIQLDLVGTEQVASGQLFN